jgi:hypothetical protein
MQLRFQNKHLHRNCSLIYASDVYLRRFGTTIWRIVMVVSVNVLNLMVTENSILHQYYWDKKSIAIFIEIF